MSAYYFLSGIDVYTKFKVLLDIENDDITLLSTNWRMPLTWKKGHLYQTWRKVVLFKVSELQKVHRHFLLARPEKMFEVLRISKSDYTLAEKVFKLESSLVSAIYAKDCPTQVVIFELLSTSPIVCSICPWAKPDETRQRYSRSCDWPR